MSAVSTSFSVREAVSMQGSTTEQGHGSSFHTQTVLAEAYRRCACPHQCCKLLT